LEHQVEMQADQLYTFDVLAKNGPLTQRKCSGSSSEDRILYAEMENRKLLRKKKHHRCVKPHRAIRSNDCQFTPRPQNGNGPLFMKARNYARIGRGRKFEKPQEKSPITANVNYDFYCLTDSNLHRYDFEDPEMTEFLLALQNGQDITPEDYDRLLKLDELSGPSSAMNERQRIAEKILKQDSIVSQPLNCDSVEFEAQECVSTPSENCSICMETSKDHGSTTLLCGHRFHSKCLRRWWNNSPSMTCPLDNLDVRNMKPQFEGRVTEPSNVPLRCLRI